MLTFDLEIQKKPMGIFKKKAIIDLDCENTFSFISIDDQVALFN